MSSFVQIPDLLLRVARLCNSHALDQDDSLPCPAQAGVRMFRELWVARNLASSEAGGSTAVAAVRLEQALDDSSPTSSGLSRGLSSCGERLVHLSSALEQPLTEAVLQAEMVCAVETSNSQNSKRGQETKVKMFLLSWVLSRVQNSLGWAEPQMARLRPYLARHPDFVFDSSPASEPLVHLRVTVVEEQKKAEERRLESDQLFQRFLDEAKQALRKEQPHSSTTRKGVRLGAVMFLEKWLLKRLDSLVPAGGQKGPLLDRLRKHPEFIVDTSDQGEKLIQLQSEVLHTLTKKIHADDAREGQERPFLRLLADVKHVCDLSECYPANSAKDTGKNLGVLLFKEDWVLDNLVEHTNVSDAHRRRLREHTDFIAGECGPVGEEERLLHIRSNALQGHTSTKRLQFYVSSTKAMNKGREWLLANAQSGAAQNISNSRRCVESGQVMVPCTVAMVNMLNGIDRNHMNVIVENMKLFQANWKANPAFVFGKDAQGTELVEAEATVFARRQEEARLEEARALPYTKELLKSSKTSKENARFCIQNQMFMFLEHQVLHLIRDHLGGHLADFEGMRNMLRTTDCFHTGISERGYPLLHLRFKVLAHQRREAIRDEVQRREDELERAVQRQLYHPSVPEPEEENPENLGHAELFKILVSHARELLAMTDFGSENSALCQATGAVMFLEDWTIKELEDSIPEKYRGNFIDRLRRHKHMVTGSSAEGYKLLDHKEAIRIRGQEEEEEVEGAEEVQTYKALPTSEDLAQKQNYRKSFKLFVTKVMQELQSRDMTRANTRPSPKYGVPMFLETYAVNLTFDYILERHHGSFVADLRRESCFNVDISEEGEKLIQVTERMRKEKTRPAPAAAAPAEQVQPTMTGDGGELGRIYSRMICGVMYALQTAPLTSKTSRLMSDGTKAHSLDWILELPQCEVPDQYVVEAHRRLCQNANFVFSYSKSGESVVMLSEKGLLSGPVPCPPGAPRGGSKPRDDGNQSETSSVGSASPPGHASSAPIPPGVIKSMKHVMDTSLFKASNTSLINIQGETRAFFKIRFILDSLPSVMRDSLARPTVTYLQSALLRLTNDFVICHKSVNTVESLKHCASENQVQKELLALLSSFGQPTLPRDLMKRLTDRALRRVRTQRGLLAFVTDSADRDKLQIDANQNVVAVGSTIPRSVPEAAPVSQKIAPGMEKFLSVTLHLLENAIVTPSNSGFAQVSPGSSATFAFFRIKWLYESMPANSRIAMGDLKQYFAFLRSRPEVVVQSSFVQSAEFIRTAASEEQLQAEVTSLVQGREVENLAEVTFKRLSQRALLRVRSKRGYKTYLETYRAPAVEVKAKAPPPAQMPSSSSSVLEIPASAPAYGEMMDERLLFRQIFYLYISSKYSVESGPVGEDGYPLNAFYVHWIWGQLAHRIPSLTQNQVVHTLKRYTRVFKLHVTGVGAALGRGAYFEVIRMELPEEDVAFISAQLITIIRECNQVSGIAKEVNGQRIVNISWLMKEFTRLQAESGGVIRILRKKVMLDLASSQKRTFVVVDGTWMGLTKKYESGGNAADGNGARAPTANKVKASAKANVVKSQDPKGFASNNPYDLIRLTSCDSDEEESPLTASVASLKSEIIQYLKYVKPNRLNSFEETPGRSAFLPSKIREYLSRQDLVESGENNGESVTGSDAQLIRFLRKFPVEFELVDDGAGVRLSDEGKRSTREEDFEEVPETNHAGEEENEELMLVREGWKGGGVGVIGFTIPPS